METYMEMLTRRAKAASAEAAKLGTEDKNRGLLSVAEELTAQQDMILAENEKDLEAAREKGIKQSLIDRLALSEKRIADMAEGLRQIAALDDPVGEVLYMKTRPNGLRVGQKRVPLGVVGIIYESRPNVRRMRSDSALRPAMRRSCAAEAMRSIPIRRSYMQSKRAFGKSGSARI